MRDARSWRLSWLPTVLLALVVLAGTGGALAGDPPARAEVAEPLEAPPAGDQPAEQQLAVFTKVAPESVDDLLEIERHVQKLAAKLIPCTVGVQIRGVQGSGVIIDKHGHVLTAGHVSGEPGRDVTVILHDGRKLKGKTLGRNIGIDSGLIKITDDGKWPFADVGSSKDLKAGQWCMATGHPGGYQTGREPVVRLGRVIQSRTGAVRTDCTLVGGDSGGPLFDMQGRVIGIHSRISTSFSENFHVPVQTYLETWNDLVAGKEWGGRGNSGIIGIRGDDVKEGCRVTEIFPGLPAEKHGLKVGDVITKVNGDKVGSLADLIRLLGKHKPGDEVTLEYLRNGQNLKQAVKLASPR
jgi:serine protease Do